VKKSWRRYKYARVVQFHDGDTCEVEIDQGFGGKMTVAVRLFGVSAPETDVEVERAIGIESREAARALLSASPFSSSCVLWTWKMSFNRYVGRLVIEEHDAPSADFARLLIANGVVRAWDVRLPRPVFTAFPAVDRAAEMAEYDRVLRRDFRADD
jgi:endonuclease YncB( thermonuclease family)